MTDQQNGAEQCSEKDGERGDPRDKVEAFGRGRGENRCTVLGGEAVEDLLIVHAGVHGCLQLSQLHRRVGAADVVALAKDLSATATAHELMVELVIAGGRIGGADGETDGNGQRSSLYGFRKFAILKHGFHLSRRPSARAPLEWFAEPEPSARQLKE